MKIDTSCFPTYREAVRGLEWLKRQPRYQIMSGDKTLIICYNKEKAEQYLYEYQAIGKHVYIKEI